VSLEQGARIGPYEVLGSLGAGGMGEVCRARDTKLNRDVALKVLPDAFATNPERMSRFQREAQLLAALNHPNIAAIYGLEDTGSRSAIVMELVEGNTLACPLPIDDALRVAKQIAEAIEYAHDRGIIHRDLKPANIKVTPEGTVKVLDFGLAKAMDDVSDTMANIAGSMSPTLSLGATYAGVIMGTAAYMAPEQAKGRPADRRSDVWAFGIVLYEMLTGHRMFGGDSVPETLASVMKDPITFGKLPDDTPPSIRKLASRCLERDPKRRLQSIGEARIVIEDAIAGVGIDETASAKPSRLRSISPWSWAVAAAGVLAAGATLAWVSTRPSPPAPAVTRFTISPADDTRLTSAGPNASHLAVSPNGRYVTWVADEPGRERMLWVRALDALTPRRLDRTDGAGFPFWSSDSQHIAYFAHGKLMRISLAGGAPLPICDSAESEGGTWFQGDGQDGVILFAPSANGPLQRVLAQGGLPAPVTKLAAGEIGHSFPQFLPDGQRFLYIARGTKTGIYVQALGSDQRTFVVESIGRAMYSPPGLLLYLRDNTLLAHHWNLETLRLEGEPVSIAEDVRSGGSNGRNAFVVSANGVLAYRGGGTAKSQVSWYARDGKRGDIVVPSQELGQLELSPDDTRLVMQRGTAEDRDLWVKDLASGVMSRLTSAPGADRDPVWSPDSRRIAYVGVKDGKDAWYETLIGSGKQNVIPHRGEGSFSDWTRDGKHLVINTRIGMVGMIPAPQEDGSTEAGSIETLLQERYVIDQLRVSPDGKWVAYTSAESGQSEITVATFPAFTDRRQISIAGGVQPLWRRDGKELFFLSRDQTLNAVDINTSAGLKIGPVRALFQTSVNTTNQVHMYAVTSDGQRFLIRELANRERDAVEQLQIATNWTSLVR
jgi:serine/threonine protein kinase/Tol biopolymer transport system component